MSNFTEYMQEKCGATYPIDDIFNNLEVSDIVDMVEDYKDESIDHWKEVAEEMKAKAVSIAVDCNVAIEENLKLEELLKTRELTKQDSDIVMNKWFISYIAKNGEQTGYGSVVWELGGSISSNADLRIIEDGLIERLECEVVTILNIHRV